MPGRLGSATAATAVIEAMTNDDVVAGPARRWRRRLRGLRSAVLAAVPALALAQTPADPTRLIDEGLRREIQRLGQQPSEPARDALKPASAAGPVQIPVESPCFAIHAVELTGPDAAGFAWLQRAAAPYLGACLGVQGLGALAAALDAALLEAGYATSKVTLPPQNLADGMLRLRLHVGRIEAVEPADGLYWRNAFPITLGGVLNIRDLEQGVEQMNRLGSRTVLTRLEPGNQPDASVLHIDREGGAGRLRGGVTLDNSGNPQLGRAQFGFSGVLDDPLGINDLLSVNLNSNLQHMSADQRSLSGALHYGVPWGYNLFSLAAQGARYAQPVQLTTAVVVSSGQSAGFELRWDRTLYRDQSSKFGVSAALTGRRARSFYDDVELLVQSRRNSFAALGASYKRLLQRAVIDAELTLRQGIGAFGAEPDYDAESAHGLTLRPRLWNLSLAVELRDLFARDDAAGALRVDLSSRLLAQSTNDRTIALDQFGIGTRGTVRGFDGRATLVAESGFAWRNEFIVPFNAGSQLLQAYLAIDVGKVWGPSAGALIGRGLAGTALGLRAQWPRLMLDVAIAAPLYEPPGFHSSSVSPNLSLVMPF